MVMKTEKMIYLDNSATTQVYPEAAAAATEAFQSVYGNPSSLHGMGIQAEKLVTAARQQVAMLVGARKEEIFFTGCGTESNNWALKGIADAYGAKGRHMITTAIEHPSILETTKYLQQKGWEVDFIAPDEHGVVAASAIIEKVRPDTVLVSMMAVNNETGAIQPMEAVGKGVKEKNPQTFFHVDGVQAVGKIPLALNHLPIDLLSGSGHKIHGPKGIGFLYVAKGVRLIPLLAGGGQEQGWRSGTENVPGIVAMGVAAEKIAGDLQEKQGRMAAIRQGFIEELLAKVPDCVINSPFDDKGAWPIVNASFPGVPSEVLLHYLEDEGIYISAGSACSARKKQYSPVLMAQGLQDDVLASAVRFSFSYETTAEELAYTAEKVSQVVQEVRSFRI
ncbi:MAG: cysteine desulfurase [Peptococcaceae bacterium]|nr:cysteine desulfurase [Peptococcaceae bacterium]